MLLIIYVGAIIILIGYVCAVCPNVNFSSNTKYLYSFVIFSLLSAFMTPSAFMAPSAFMPVFNFFYSSSGVSVFILLVFMLFIILLVVTSYYFSPKGPFRSVS
jgi:hypothetical protein